MAVPLQKAASWPKLFQYVPGAVPYGFSDEFMPHPNDKQIFLGMLREKERRRRGTETVADLMESSYERNFFEMSFHMKTVHREWIKHHPHTTEQYIRSLGQLHKVCHHIVVKDYSRMHATRAELLRRIRLVQLDFIDSSVSTTADSQNP